MLPGVNEIYLSLLKKAEEEIAVILTITIQFSLALYVVSEDWRTAKAVLLFKREERKKAQVISGQLV